jgi:hypothetical protein
MATNYWRGTTNNNWDGAANNWSLGHVPTSSEDVAFDASSPNPSVLNMSPASMYCKSLDFTGAPGDITWSGSYEVSISGNLTLKSGMTITNDGDVLFSSSAIFTSNTAVLHGAIRINGNGITVTLGDDCTIQGLIDIHQGTLDITGHNFTCGTVTDSTSTHVRGLILGTSTLQCSSFALSVGGTLTLDADEGIIKCSSVFIGLGITYNEVELNGAACEIRDSNTYTNLKIIGTASLADSCTIYANQTITGTLTITGNSARYRSFVTSDITGTARTLTAEVVSIIDCDFRDITAAGTAAPFTGTRLGNCAGNSQITMTVADDKYAVTGDASKNWSDDIWALSSGGATSVDNFPLPQDTAIFDNSTWTDNTARTLTCNTYRLPGFTWSAMTRTSKSFTVGINQPCYGNMVLKAGLTVYNGSATITLANRTTQSITSDTVQWFGKIVIDSIGGTVSLVDKLTLGATRSLTLTNGTFDANDQDVSIGSFISSNSNTRTLTMGGGAWTLTGTGTVWDLTVNGIEFTFNKETANIKLNQGSGTTACTFAGGGKTYNFLTQDGTGNYILTITGSNVFDTLVVNNPPKTIKFTAGTTTTITTDFDPKGEAGKLVTIGSVTSASHTLSLTTGTVEVSYCSISRSDAIGGTLWQALVSDGNVNGGNNTGWVFGAFIPKIIMT